MWSGRVRPRRVAAVVAVALAPSLVVGVALAQLSTGADQPVVTRVHAQTFPEPTPPSPPGTLDPSMFREAAKRPPAAPVLARLPQVDVRGLSVVGIPKAALRAYVTAARLADQEDTSCHLRWWLLAGIGLVESAHGRSGGSGTAGWNGIAKPPIFGPRLDGKNGYAAIRDTDHGTLDRDRTWDRAVGPMQFLPQTWQRWGGTTLGRLRDPQDIRAAALAAAGYLCAGSAGLAQPQGLATAVFSYNHSFDYVRLVLTVAARYAGIDPRSLGVDRLPHDKHKHKRKQAKPKPKPTPARAAPAVARASAATTAQTGSPSLPPAPLASEGSSLPSPSPSPSDSLSPAPSPDPTDTASVASP